MTSFDAVTSAGMSELSPYTRDLQGQLDIPMDTQTICEPSLHGQDSSGHRGVILEGPRKSCAQAAWHKQLVLQLRRRRKPPLWVSRTSLPSRPGFSLLLYWKRSIHQPINYQHLTYAARQPAGYFESHCPLRQITRGWTWRLITCSYFDCALILLSRFNCTAVFQLTEVIRCLASPRSGFFPASPISSLNVYSSM